MAETEPVPKPSRESFESSAIPPRPVEEIAAEALQDLKTASGKLTEWGVKIPAESRLFKASAILERAAKTGELAPAQRGDDLGLRSLEFAFDYAAIADTLPPKRIAVVRHELERSLIGELDPPSEARGPLQLQSQFVVRAAFVRAGLNPDHPKPTEGVKNPDLVLENGIASYGVEVKRPRTETGLLARFDDARDQLEEYGLLGAVLVDVTDCVRGVSLPDVGKEVRRLALQLYARAFETGRGYKPGYKAIMVAGTFARVAWHTESETEADQSMVNVHTTSVVGVFATTEGNLLDHHGKWIRRTFEDGLEKLYRTLSE